MFEIKKTNIPGCLEIIPTVFEDYRGSFVKIFHDDEFIKLGLQTIFSEEYYSVSKKGVVRGMHFQTPPHDQVTIVYCLCGKVFDVVIEIRKGSPKYGEYLVFELDPEKPSMIYIPSGLAHGFYAMEDNTLMVYKVTMVYSPENDTGIRWDSAGVSWPAEKPIISERDAQFEKFCDFKTPFIYQESK